MTTEEAARALGVTARTVRAYIRARRIAADSEHMGLRRIWRIARAEVERVAKEIRGEG